MITGTFTALVTPFTGEEVDYQGLDSLVDYQIQNGITGILAVGTTGESPSLNWDEHNKVIEKVVDKCKGKCKTIAGTGSNNTKEALAGSKHAAEIGADALLLVDPYYNGPSSLEIRREYIEPIAAAVPDTEIISYVIPGRTGTQLLPEDLGILNEKFPNVSTVKEATADPENMRRTRTCCGPDFSIMSGDDGMTFILMTDPGIVGSGVISVASNVVPGAVSQMVNLIKEGDISRAEKLRSELEPLFGLVAVKSEETTPYGTVSCKARNPLGVKTLMQILGMPCGPCRQPLGKMTRNGIDMVVEAARKVHLRNPDILRPVAEFFNVDIEDRLNNEAYREGLFYESY